MALSARSRIRPSVRPWKTARGGDRAPRAAWTRAILRAWWQQAARSRFADASAAGLLLARGERILAAQYDPRGSHVVGTDRALYHRAGQESWQRLGWEHITQVAWDGAAAHLVVTSLAGVAPARTALPLRDYGTMAWLAQERISATRIASQRVVLGGRHHAWAEARRRPGTDELCWLITLGDGLDPAEREVRDQVGRALTVLREVLGLADLFSEDCCLISGTGGQAAPGPAWQVPSAPSFTVR